MIKKLLVSLLLVQLQVFANHYKSTIIELEAKLFPKMLMLSEDIKKDSQYLHIYIIAQEKDMNRAKEFKTAIESNYKEKLMNKTVKVYIQEFHSIENYPDGIIVLHHSQEELLRISNWANANKIVSFSYEPSYLDFGILGSLYIGASTKPYLNKKVIKKYKFNFNPYLLELSKFK
jgi:hypothetical protein